MILQICVMIWLAHLSPVLLIPMLLKYPCCVRARDLGMKPIIIDVRPMWKFSECRVRFGHCVRSLPYTEIYRSALTKIFQRSKSVLHVSRDFCNAYTDAVHLMQLPSWVHWYRRCIVSGIVPDHRQRLVDVCTHKFHDKVWHMDSILTLCSFKWFDINSLPVCHVS